MWERDETRRGWVNKRGVFVSDRMLAEQDFDAMFDAYFGCGRCTLPYLCESCLREYERDRAALEGALGL